jgi:hypothetical protein
MDDAGLPKTTVDLCSGMDPYNHGWWYMGYEVTGKRLIDAVHILVDEVMSEICL